MFIHHLFEAGLTPRPAVDTDAFRRWFGNSKVVDAEGRPLAVYHGTGRPDRVGARFRKSRATAGPMAYFTDDPAVASGYAQGKADTSIDDDDYLDYASWFKVKVKGMRSEVPLARAWFFLPHDEQRRIASLGPKVRNEEGETVVDEDNDSGNGSYRDNLRMARGNALKAMAEDWLSSGILFNEEHRFLDVLRLAGMTSPVRFDHPHATSPAVYAVYMSIQKPLVSTAVPDAVVAALQKAAGRQRPLRAQTGQSWSKKNTDARAWMRELLDDIEQTGGQRFWTVVPDWVTKVLKSFGYDGIRDVGGKQGGVGHDVWIPFDDRQVKSALSNTSFDPGKASIHEDDGPSAPNPAAPAQRLAQTRSGASIADRAKALFGVTRNPREAGYILPDGSMLDLSGRHQVEGDYQRDAEGRAVLRARNGRSAGRDWMADQRSTDHREVNDLYRIGSGTEAMRRFMAEAPAVRFQPGSGFDVNAVPTSRQLAVAFAAHFAIEHEALHIDVSDPRDGRNLASRAFEAEDIRKAMPFIRRALAGRSAI